MTAYMLEWQTRENVWIKVGSVYMDRRDADYTRERLRYTNDGYRVVPVELYLSGAMGSVESVPVSDCTSVS